MKRAVGKLLKIKTKKRPKTAIRKKKFLSIQLEKTAFNKLIEDGTLQVSKDRKMSDHSETDDYETEHAEHIVTVHSENTGTKSENDDQDELDNQSETDNKQETDEEELYKQEKSQHPLSHLPKTPISKKPMTVDDITSVLDEKLGATNTMDDTLMDKAATSRRAQINPTKQNNEKHITHRKKVSEIKSIMITPKLNTTKTKPRILPTPNVQLRATPRIQIPKVRKHVAKYTKGKSGKAKEKYETEYYSDNVQSDDEEDDESSDEGETYQETSDTTDQEEAYEMEVNKIKKKRKIRKPAEKQISGTDQLARALNKMCTTSKGHKPPEYQSTTSAHIFINAFDDWIELQEETDHKAALAFKNSIRDDVALMWLDRLPQKVKKSYVKLREKFLENYDETAPEFYKMTLSQAPRQREHESVRQYYRRFYKCFSRMADDKMLTTEFVKGLLGKYKLQMYQGKIPKDITSAMRKACKWEEILLDQSVGDPNMMTINNKENIQALMNNNNTNSQREQSTSAIVNANVYACFKCGSTEHLIRQCPQNNNANRGYGRNYRGRGYNNRGYNTNMGRGYVPYNGPFNSPGYSAQPEQEQAQQMNTPVQNRGRGFNYYGRGGRGGSRPRINPNIVCYVCGENHYAYVCEHRCRPEEKSENQNGLENSKTTNSVPHMTNAGTEVTFANGTKDGLHVLMWTPQLNKEKEVEQKKDRVDEEQMTFKLQDYFDSDNALALEIKLQGCCQTQILVDSGASCCVIKYDYWKEIGGHETDLKLYNNQHITTACNTSLGVVGSVNLTIELEGIRLVHDFIILKELTANLILGMDFLMRYGCKMDIQNQTMTMNIPGKRLMTLDMDERPLTKDFNNEEVMADDMIGRLLRQTTLKPGEEKKVKIATSSNMSKDHYQLEPVPAFVEKYKGIYIEKKKLFTGNENIEEIKLTNNSKEEITLYQGTRMVLFREALEESKEEKDEVDKLIQRVKENKDLKNIQINQICGVIEKWRHVFVSDTAKLSTTNVHQVKIVLEDQVPVNVRNYQHSITNKEKCKKHIEQLLEGGLITHSSSPYNAPCMIVHKGNKDRFVIDYRKINAKIRRDSYPLPLISEILHGFNGSELFSKFDLTKSFHQIPLEEHSRKYTTFSVSGMGSYQWTSIPFGLHLGTGCMQRIMDHVLRGEQPNIIPYVDDIILHHSNFESHLSAISRVLEKLSDAQLCISPQKTELFQKKMEFVGHIVSAKGIEVQPDKLEAILQFPVPMKQKQVRSFMGMLNYQSAYIKNFTETARPLQKLTGKGVKFQWEKEHQVAFETLKNKLTSPPILKSPDFTKPFLITSDASNEAISAVMEQIYEDRKFLVDAVGRCLNQAEKNYSTTEKELLAVIYAIQKWKSFLLSTNQITVFQVDHLPLTHIKKLENFQGRMSRWMLILNEVPHEIKYIAGKNNKFADALSRREYLTEMLQQLPKSMSSDQSKKEIYETFMKEHKLDDDKETRVAVGLTPPCTENIKLIQTRSKTKNQEIIDNEPSKAPTKAPLSKIKNLIHETSMQKKISENQKKDVWVKEMIDYLKENKLPRDLVREKEILNTSTQYFMDEEHDILYREFQPNPHHKPTVLYEQLVLPDSMVAEILYQTHDVPYIGGHRGHQKVYLTLQPHVYFKNMYTVTKNYVKSCQICAKRKSPRRKFRTPIVSNMVGEPIPFHCVEIDFIGPLTPSEGKRYIMTVIDAFSRFGIGVPLPNISAESTAKAIMDHVVLKYGTPAIIRSDNGPQLRSNMLSNLENLLEIKHVFGAPYHPQSQAKVERWNGTLMQAVSMYCSGNPRTWNKYLQKVIFSYNISVHSQTKQVPFEVVHTFGATIPCFANLKPRQEGLVGDIQEYMAETAIVATQSRDRLLEEVKKGQIYNKIHHDKTNTQKTKLNIGNLVWVYNPPIKKGVSKKLIGQRWIGPYRLERLCESGVTFELSTPNKRKVPVIVHCNRIKPFVSRKLIPVVAPNMDNYDHKPIPQHYYPKQDQSPILRSFETTDGSEQPAIYEAKKNSSRQN